MLKRCIFKLLIQLKLTKIDFKQLLKKRNFQLQQVVKDLRQNPERGPQ